MNPLEHEAKRQLERAERRVKHKISSFVMGLVILPIALCLFASVFGGIIWYVMDQKAEMDAPSTPVAGVGGVPTPSSAPVAPPATTTIWDGASTFECAGNTATSLTNQTVVASFSPAIRARANCRLTLTHVNITAPVVIDAQNNAQVNVIGGSLNGSQNSIVAANRATVSVGGATVTGPVQRLHAAQVTGVP